jgi:hypothetical protein
MRGKRPIPPKDQRTSSFGSLTQTISAFHRDLLAFQARTEERFDRMYHRLDSADGRFDRIEKRIRNLRRNLPGIVIRAMREGLRERRKSRKIT